jgi:hypothetical protein
LHVLQRGADPDPPGRGTSVLAVSRLASEGVAIPSPGRVYYETLGAGLVLALLIILLTIPLLRRMSAPGNVRFE